MPWLTPTAPKGRHHSEAPAEKAPPLKRTRFLRPSLPQAVVEQNAHDDRRHQQGGDEESPEVKSESREQARADSPQPRHIVVAAQYAKHRAQ